MSLVQYVNPLQGTDSHHGLSKGNTLPLIAWPFGMNHWSPQTAEGSWFFSPRHAKLMGIRCTHQPSPWMGDYGAFTVMPQSGRRLLTAFRRAAGYRVDRSVFSPHYFRAELVGNGTVLEMAPSLRGAVMRFAFPEGRASRIIIESPGGESSFALREDRKTIVGYTTHNSGGTPSNFKHWFVAVLDREVTGFCTFSGEDVWDDSEPRTGEKLGIALELDGAGVVTMRIATSFISEAQAEQNLRTELGKKSFEAIRDEAEAEWEASLGRIRVESDSERDLRTFYSCLYRTQLFPRVFHEVDASGVTKHYSPYDGEVHEGVLYTDNGFWDTFRTMYPLLALLDPKRLAEILQGWVNAYKEGGWFPQWATPGYRACMVGTHIDAVMADAVARGVVDFDIGSALEGMLKHAYEVGDPKGAFGRIGIEDYKSLGYVSNKHHESVARSLDYAYDDFCIAQVAKHLGREEEAAELLERAGNYRHLFDPAVGFMRARNADGTWQEPWDEFWWGNPYVEGGPWQSSWAVQHDIDGLIELIGGREAFVAKLDQLLATPPHFEVGAYGFEIHEMTEMGVADFGQYAHSNQPVHHVLYLYSAAGRPDRTREEVMRVMRELYSPDEFAGDEDNGEMSAWFVLSALGIFPLCPGRPEWTLGVPFFRRAILSMPGGELEVLREGERLPGEVRQVSINGELLSDSIGHQELVKGGRLSFS